MTTSSCDEMKRADVEHRIEMDEIRKECAETEFIMSMSGVSNSDAGALYGYERVDLIVDSGASTSAIPSSAVPSINVETAPNSHLKVYTSASGHQVKEKGFQNLTCHFQDGDKQNLKFKVMSPDVPRGMVSVSECVRAGNRIVFDKDFSYIHNAQNNTYKRIYEKGGVFVLPLWIERGDSSFRRQARL
jgi:hypothetical protein